MEFFRWPISTQVFGFYDCHVQFSAMAATWLARGIKIDWFKQDNNLYCSLFLGQRASTWQLCHSLHHLTPFCPQHSGKKLTRPSQQHHDSSRHNSRPLAAFGSTDQSCRPPVSYGNREICNNFNSPQGYTQIDCRNAHVCLKCKGRHSTPSCTGAAEGKHIHVLTKWQGDYFDVGEHVLHPAASLIMHHWLSMCSL